LYSWGQLTLKSSIKKYFLDKTWKIVKAKNCVKESFGIKILGHFDIPFAIKILVSGGGGMG